MAQTSLVSRGGLAITRVFRAVVPDPFVLAVLLLCVTCVLGIALGKPAGSEGAATTWVDRALRLGDAFRDAGPGGSHMWSLLGFAMQMCLVLVGGHVLAAAPPVRRAIRSLAAVPRTGPGGAAWVGAITCVAALLNWGLGLIVGALLAREVGRVLVARGVGHHYPLLVAAGYTGMMVWHGGLSGSAPLTMTTAQGAARTLPPDVLSTLQSVGFTEGIPLTQTLFSSFNLVITLGLLVLTPLVLWLIAPPASASTPMDERTAPPAPDESATSDATHDRERSVPIWLEGARIINVLLAIALALGLWRFLDTTSLWRLGLSEVIAAILVLALLLHPSPRSFVAALDDAAKGCGGIVVQFPIYAAIIGVMVQTGLIRTLADVASTASPTLLPVTTFLSACVINLFVPSGGGQWAVQGPIALQAGLAAGVSPGKMVMAVAYGDQLTNMLQPFWALPLLAITGAKARDVVGYTALVMIVGGVWIGLCLLVL